VAKYRIQIKPSAAQELEAVPQKKDRQRLVDCIRQLARNPRPPGCEKLSGQDKYRVRQGPYRIVYAIEDDVLLVYAVKVGHRREVYD
jgi:mRNA interferase RelE/StbE